MIPIPSLAMYEKLQLNADASPLECLNAECLLSPVVGYVVPVRVGLLVEGLGPDDERHVRTPTWQT